MQSYYDKNPVTTTYTDKKRSSGNTKSLQQVEVVQFVVVLHDSPLELACIDPRNEVFHVARDEESWICNWIWSYSYVALLNVLYSL